MIIYTDKNGKATHVYDEDNETWLTEDDFECRDTELLIQCDNCEAFYERGHKTIHKETTGCGED